MITAYLHTTQHSVFTKRKRNKENAVRGEKTTVWMNVYTMYYIPRTDGIFRFVYIAAWDKQTKPAKQNKTNKNTHKK